MAYSKSLNKEIKDIEIFLEDLALIFMTNFMKFDFKYEDIFNLMRQKNETINYLIDKLILIKNTNNLISIANLKSLQPIFKDKDLNLFISYLNAIMINSFSKSIFNIFNWYLKKFYLFKMLDYTFYKDKENEIINYLDFYNISIINTSSKISGALFSNSKKIDTFAKVYMQERQVKDGGLGFDTYLKRIKTTFEKSSNSEYNHFLFLHNIIFNSIRTKNDSETNLMVSILNIFSFLGSLFELDQNNFDKEFKDLFLEKTVIVFGDDKDGKILTKDLNFDFEKLTLYKELKAWVNYKNTLEIFSVKLIEDFWTEFHERESIIQESNKVAEYLELQIYVFFNALFKTIKQYKNITNESIQLIRSADKARIRFEGNIKDTKYEKLNYTDISKDNLDLLEYILLCPLWKYLINYPKNISLHNELKLDGGKTLDTYYDYLNLLSLHKIDSDLKSDENKNNLEIENKSTNEKKKFSRYSKNKIEDIIKDKEYNFNDSNIINIIWNDTVSKYNLNKELTDQKIEDIYTVIKEKEKKKLF